jgi:hypothetical protein
MSVDRLCTWLTERLTSAPPADAIVLRHGHAAGQSETIGREPVPQGPPGDVARQLAERLWGAAHGHALAFPGRPQTFRVTAVSQGKARASTAILVKAEGRAGARTSPVIDGSEPPTRDGQLAQMMRLLEGCFQVTLGAQTGIIDSLARQNAELLRSQERLLHERVAATELAEDLRSQQFEREERRLAAAASREERHRLVEAVADKALPQLGETVGKLLPRLLGERPSSDLREPLKRILIALKPETVRAMLGDMPPDTRDDLEQLFAVLAAAEKEEA